MESPREHSQEPLRRFAIGCVLALIAIGMVVLAGQIVVQSALRGQAHDARLVNIAGRQRMLSERIATLALMLEVTDAAAGERQRVIDDLARAADLLEKSHRALRQDPELRDASAANVEPIYAEIESHFRAILASVRQILEDPPAQADATATLLLHVDPFLLGMDRIVLAYDKDATARVDRLARLELALAALVVALLVVEGMWVFRPLVAGVRGAFVQMEQRQAKLEKTLEDQRALEQQLIGAADRARQRIGEDLHDGVCQHLVGVSYMLRALRPKVQSGQVAERLVEAAVLVEEAVGQMRRMAKGLHPIGVEMHGLPSALEELGEAISSTYGIPCEVRCDDIAEDVPNEIAMQLFLIAQEALSNAAKHSSASRIEVVARELPDKMELAIGDDGIGLEASPKVSMGLKTMASRAHMIGAQLELVTPDAGGTVVRCSLPLTELEKAIEKAKSDKLPEPHESEEDDAEGGGDPATNESRTAS